MLEEFSYLGDRAYEVVVENANKISDQVEHFKPVPDRDQLYSPTIPGAKEKVESRATPEPTNGTAPSCRRSWRTG